MFRNPIDNSICFDFDPLPPIQQQNQICSFVCRLLGKAGGKTRIFISEIPRFPVGLFFESYRHTYIFIFRINMPLCSTRFVFVSF